jgi:DNA-binding MarR family transcriptional regulator
MSEQIDVEGRESGALERRTRMEVRGRALAEDRELDVSAYEVCSNLHWAFTLFKVRVERGPLAQAGLSMSGFVTLWSLWVHGEMEAKALAAEVGIARSSLSELARRLEERQLILRKSHPSDGRAVLFDLTDEGRVAIEAIWPKLNETEAEATATLSVGRRSSLAAMLREMSDQLTTLLENDDV